MLEASLFDSHSFYLLIKVAILISFAFYIIFALVIVKQVHKMTDTLEVGFETPIRIFAWAHLLLSIGLFVIGLGIL